MRRWLPSLEGKGILEESTARATATNSAYAGVAYRSSWSVQRAVKDGYERVIWVFRAVDHIASSASRLPLQLRVGDETGPPAEGAAAMDPLMRLLNRRSNAWETAANFRYRLSSQLLLSKKGAFVEVVRSRRGDPIALHLLPCGDTSPIPDPVRFVSEFEVVLNGVPQRIPAYEEDGVTPHVLWIRRPHPTDPYSGITPMEAAGLSIDMDFYARLYNRSFLQNDGRPGGLLTIKGNMDSDDKDELRRRFGGGPSQAGRTSVIKAEDSKWLDTAITPRDAQFAEVMRITKTDVLDAFGVFESLIGNASGKCLRASEYVRLANGERHQAKDLVGKQFRLLTSTKAGQVEVGAWATWEAVEPIYRVTTESGRTLEVNGRHPLYAGAYTRTREAGWRSANGPRIDVRGWTPTDALTTGMVLAVPSKFEQQGGGPLASAEAKVLGYLVGDGSMSAPGGHVALTTPDGEMVKDFRRAVEAMGDEVVQYETGSSVATWGVRATSRKGAHGGRDTNHTRALLRATGLLGTTSHTKFVPSSVFAARTDVQADFLGALWAADGCIHVAKPQARRPGNSPSTRTTVSLVTVSHRLALDVQELLLRLGINSRIRHRTGIRTGFPASAGRTFAAYEVSLSTAADVSRFCVMVEVPGKMDQVHAAYAVTRGKSRNVPAWRERGLNPGLRWERVASVELVGVDQTVGIAAPEHHTYLSTFWEHNTFDNAAQEKTNFWQETMPPHLDLIAGSFDFLTAGGIEDDLFLVHDVEGVPILQKAREDREKALKDLVDAGCISPDEFREETGRDPLNTRASRSLWIAGTKKPVADPLGPEDDLPAVPEPVPAVQATAAGVAVKRAEVPREVKALTSSADEVDRRVTARTADLRKVMRRYFNRQERVVLERLSGVKARRGTPLWDPPGTKAVEVGDVLDAERWDAELSEDLEPEVRGIYSDEAEAAGAEVPEEAADGAVAARLAAAAAVNATTGEKLATALVVGDDETAADVRGRVQDVFEEARTSRADMIAETEAAGATNDARDLIAAVVGAERKKWRSRGDAKVRETHASAHGQEKDVGEAFTVGGATMRYPGDPTGPVKERARCRCWCEYLSPSMGSDG